MIYSFFTFVLLQEETGLAKTIKNQAGSHGTAKRDCPGIEPAGGL